MGVGVGEVAELGAGEALGEGEGEVRRDIKPVVALKVKNPTTASARMVRRPVENAFMAYILHQGVNIYIFLEQTCLTRAEKRLYFSGEKSAFNSPASRERRGA